MHDNPTPLARPRTLASVPPYEPINGHEEHVAAHARLDVYAPEPGGRLKIPKLSAGLRLCSDGQRRHAGMPAPSHDEVHTLPTGRKVGR